jgi:hypothetical protein
MKFKILWIDDRPSSIISKKEEIEEFLKKEGFEPDIELISDIENIKNILEEKINGDIDLIVTDNNLDEDFSGIDVIKRIGDRKILVDVLFYSSPPFKEEEVTRSHHFIEIVDDKTKILGSLKKLIKKNIKRCEDPVFLRGYILSRAVDLEIELNELFEIYFKINDLSKMHFHSFLMENKSFSLYGKKATLSKIISSNESILKDIVSLNKLQDIGDARNILAHCKIDCNDSNCFVSMGESKKYGRAELKNLLEKINEAIIEIITMKDKLRESFKEQNDTTITNPPTQKLE